jgi:hypothetical protein
LGGSSRFPGHLDTAIDLSGPLEMNHKQMATELSEALGHKIVFQDLLIEEYTASLTKMGVPAYVVQHFVGAILDYHEAG